MEIACETDSEQMTQGMFRGLVLIGRKRMVSGFVFSRRLFSAKIPLRLGRDRRVGGFRPMRLELVRGLFVPVPFELARRPTHHFSDRPRVFCHRKRPGRLENGGLDSVLDRQAIGVKGFCTGDNARESTHPPYGPRPPCPASASMSPGSWRTPDGDRLRNRFGTDDTGNVSRPGIDRTKTNGFRFCFFTPSFFRQNTFAAGAGS